MENNIDITEASSIIFPAFLISLDDGEGYYITNYKKIKNVQKLF